MVTKTKVITIEEREGKKFVDAIVHWQYKVEKSSKGIIDIIPEIERVDLFTSQYETTSLKRDQEKFQVIGVCCLPIYPRNVLVWKEKITIDFWVDPEKEKEGEE